MKFFLYPIIQYPPTHLLSNQLSYFSNLETTNLCVRLFYVAIYLILYVFYFDAITYVLQWVET